MIEPAEKTAPQPVVIDPRRNLRVAGLALGGTLFMLGMSFAAVPLYDMFCRVTGFGGTTQVATKAPDRVEDRLFTVRFDANVAAGLGWRFEPEVTEITIRAGEVKTVGYSVRNLRSETSTAVASYNVTPDRMGPWFNKLACFCFTDITLKPGESRSEEVVFFIDPAIVKEKELEGLHSVTLSYTFFPSKNPAKPVADAGASSAASAKMQQ
jgi:cytochrome c oxidase assembly protein subunit 11